jgi:hypothetical protein
MAAQIGNRSDEFNAPYLYESSQSVANAWSWGIPVTIQSSDAHKLMTRSSAVTANGSELALRSKRTLFVDSSLAISPTQGDGAGDGSGKKRRYVHTLGYGQQLECAEAPSPDQDSTFLLCLTCNLMQ